MQRLTLVLFTVATLTLWSGPGLYAANSHSHDSHSHDSHEGQPALSLNNGSKWETDEALRHGMIGIRDLVDAHQQQGGGGYPELAHGIRSNVDHVIENCKLDPEADAALHVVLGDVFDGIALLEGEKGENARGQGVDRIAHALEQYGRYFDHPDWADVHTAH